MELDPKTKRRIDSMEIVTSMDTGGKSGRAVALALIDAPRERVWNVIGDFEHYKEFMPQTTESEVLERTESKVLFKTTLDFAVKKVWYVIRLDLDMGRFRVAWKMTEGSIASNEGSWDLEAYGTGRTLAKYTLYTDPGFPIPSFLLNRATRGTLPLVIEAVRKRVKLAQYA